jgi:hypothetical protein
MGAQTVAAISAFAIGVIVTTLTNWFARRLEAKKHVVHFASDAFVDMANAYTAYRGFESLVLLQAGQLSDDEFRNLQRKMAEAKAKFLSSKARVAVFGSREANMWFAEVERRGGVTGKDMTTRELTTRFVQSLREQLGYSKGDVPHEDLATVIFGPTTAEQIGPQTNGTRGWSFDVDRASSTSPSGG